MHRTKAEIQDEAKIIAQAKHNPEVFGILYEKYYKAIFLFVNKRVSSEQSTADLVSQTFLKAMVNLGKYKHQGLPFSAWLYRIASNQVNDFYRNSQRNRFVGLEKGDLERFCEEIDEPTILKTPEVLIELLNTLEEDELQLIELRYFEGHSVKETAFILDMSESNVKVRAHRILHKMRNNAE